MRNVITIDPSCLLDAAPHFYKMQQSSHLLWFVLDLLNVFEMKEINVTVSSVSVQVG